MKTNPLSYVLIVSLVLLAGCNSRKSEKKVKDTSPETTAVPDTGFTGIKQYRSGNKLIKEVTFNNGVREGLMKSF
jgi:antitoxin component YwqK of YwqJK toxin-antitoxin module